LCYLYTHFYTSGFVDTNLQPAFIAPYVLRSDVKKAAVPQRIPFMVRKDFLLRVPRLIALKNLGWIWRTLPA